MVTCDELPIVVSTSDDCKPVISEPMNILTETPITITINISSGLPLVDNKKRFAILNASFILEHLLMKIIYIFISMKQKISSNMAVGIWIGNKCATPK